MRLTQILLVGFAVVFAVTGYVRAEEADVKSNEENDIIAIDDAGDIISIDGVQFDISQLSADDLEAFLAELEELEKADPDGDLYIDVDDLVDSDERR